MYEGVPAVSYTMAYRMLSSFDAGTKHGLGWLERVAPPFCTSIVGGQERCPGARQRSSRSGHRSPPASDRVCVHVIHCNAEAGDALLRTHVRRLVHATGAQYVSRGHGAALIPVRSGRRTRPRRG